jgi:hypothetical protein
LKPDWQTEDGSIALYLGDCLDVLPTLEADVAITDPPFGAQTHAGAQTGANGGEQLVDFDPVTAEHLGDVWEQLVLQVCRRWVVATIEWRHATELERRNLLIRLGVWVKPNGAPQFTGDRPGTGWEAVAICHRPGRKRWNGGGHHATWRFCKTEGDHPTQKPLDLVEAFVEQFSDSGETVLDPFMGSGTTGVACIRTGRRFIGIEKEPKYFAIAVKRIEAELQRHTLFEEPPKIVQRSLIEEDAA